MTPRQRHAIRQQPIEDCRNQAVQIMTLPLGQQAADNGYYTEMFGWVYDELVAGRTPAGVPRGLVEEWKKLGDYRMERIRARRVA